jgi:hypothetical protein
MADAGSRRGGDTSRCDRRRVRCLCGAEAQVVRRPRRGHAAPPAWLGHVGAPGRASSASGPGTPGPLHFSGWDPAKPSRRHGRAGNRAARRGHFRRFFLLSGRGEWDQQERRSPLPPSTRRVDSPAMWERGRSRECPLLNSGRGGGRARSRQWCRLAPFRRSVWLPAAAVSAPAGLRASRSLRSGSA